MTRDKTTQASLHVSKGVYPLKTGARTRAKNREPTARSMVTPLTGSHSRGASHTNYERVDDRILTKVYLLCPLPLMLNQSYLRRQCILGGPDITTNPAPGYPFIRERWYCITQILN